MSVDRDGRWPRGRSVDGGIDEIPLPTQLQAPGRLWLCGKHLIGPDVELVLERVGVTTVVCLTERFELVDRYPDYVEWLDRERSGRAVWLPIHDLSVPADDAFVGIVRDLAGRLRHGERIVVHCAAGIGRSGTVATGVLIELGMDRDEALAHVAAHRPMAGPEGTSQLAIVDMLVARRSSEDAHG